MTNALFSRRSLLLGGAAVTLAGCSGLIGPSGPPLKIYVLQPALGPVDAPTASWQIAIGKPTCDDSLDSERIALFRGSLMDYYADAQWSDEAPKLVQTLLVEAFEKSGHMAGVARDGSGLHADYLLQLELRDFEARYDTADGAPIVVVALMARLAKASDREIVATLNSTHQVRASANSVPAVVDAFAQATGATLEEIVGWALRAPKSDTPSPDGPPPVRRHHHGV